MQTTADHVRLRLNVNYEDSNFTAAEIEKHKAACALLETAVNSRQFYDLLMNRNLVQTNVLSNQEIYDLILAGKEKLDVAPDSEIDVFPRMYYEANSVVGWTKPSIVQTYANRKFFKSYDYAGIARNIFHEWLHKLGFGHDSNLTSRRPDSVPYALGEIIDYLVTQLIAGVMLTDMSSGNVEDTSPEPMQSPPAVKYRVVCSRSWKTLWTKKVCRKVAA